MKFIDLYRQVQSLAAFYTDRTFFTAVNGVYDGFLTAKQDPEYQANNEAKYIEKLKKELTTQFGTQPNIDETIALATLASSTTKQTIAQSQPVLTSISLASLLPPEVEITDLTANRLLVNDDELAAAKEQFNTKKELKSITTQSGIQIIRFANSADLYAIPKKKSVGKGSTGDVYPIQNLTTGAWDIVKIRDKRKAEKRRDTKDLTTLISIEITNLKNAEQYIGDFSTDKQTYIGIKRTYGPTLESLSVSNMPAVRIVQLMKAILLEAKNKYYDQGLLHRDLRAPNIVIDAITGQPTIIDLELVVEQDSNTHSYVANNTEIPPFNPLFCAPEWTKQFNDTQQNIFNEKTEVNTLGLTFIHWLKLAKKNNYATTLLKPDTDAVQIAASPIPEEIKPVMIDFLKGMINIEPTQRFTFDEAIAKLQALEDNLLPIMAKFRDIATVNLEEIIDATTGKLKVEFIMPLRLFDKVYLIYPKQTYTDGKNIHLNCIIETLTKEHGIRVAGILGAPVDQYELTNVISATPAYLESKEATTINNYCYLTANDTIQAVQQDNITLIKIDNIKEPINFSNQIIDARATKKVSILQFNHVMKALYDELERTLNKHREILKTGGTSASERLVQRQTKIKITMQVIASAYNAHTLSHQSLHDRLNTLEKEVFKLHTSSFHYHFINLFGIGKQTEGAKKLKELAKDVQVEAGIVELPKVHRAKLR